MATFALATPNVGAWAHMMCSAVQTPKDMVSNRDMHEQFLCLPYIICMICVVWHHMLYTYIAKWPTTKKMLYNMLKNWKN
jgi:hypothetical protein